MFTEDAKETDLQSLTTKMDELASQVGRMHPEDPRCVPLMTELSRLVSVVAEKQRAG